MKSHPTDLSIVLPKIVKEGVDCLEFHAISNDENDVDEKWKFLNSLYNGVLSICVDRAKLSNEALISRLNRMLSIREPYTTIIQADGAPMSGGKNDYRTTLQAVATAELLQKKNCQYLRYFLVEQIQKPLNLQHNVMLNLQVLQ